MYKKINFLIFLSLVYPTILLAQLKFDDAKPLDIPVESYLTNPNPSPDGKYLAFSSAKYQGIYLFDLQTEKLTELDNAPSSGWRFKWNSSATSITYRKARYTASNRKEHAIVIADISTKEQDFITDWDEQAPGMPSWSTENDEIIFTKEAISTRDNEKPIVYKTGVEKAQAFNQPIKGIAFTFSDNEVWQISSSDQKVIYSNPNNYPILDLHSFKDEFAIIEEVGSPLLRMNLKSSTIDTLLQAEEASISPDGTTIVCRYSLDDGHNYVYSELIAYDLQSKEVLDRFSSSSLMPFSPKWSADGEKIYFSDLLSGQLFEIGIINQEDK